MLFVKDLTKGMRLAYLWSVGRSIQAAETFRCWGKSRRDQAGPEIQMQLRSCELRRRIEHRLDPI